MPDFDMWGPEQNGARVQQLTQQKMQISNIAMQQSMQEIDGAKTLQQQRQQEMQIKATEQQKQAKQKADMEAIAMDNKGKGLESYGNAMVDAGYVDEGGKVLKQAADIVEKRALTKHQEALAGQEQMKQNLKLFETLGSVVDRTNSESEWTDVKAKITSVMGKPLPAEIANSKWSPELKKRLQDFSMSRKDQLELKLQESRDASTAALHSEQMRLEKAREGLVAAETRLADKRADNVGKVDGAHSIVARTPKEDVSGALHLLRDKFPQIKLDAKGHVEDVGMVAAAESIAGEAQMLLRKNKALSRPEALQQAFNTALANGDLSVKDHKNDLTEFGDHGKDIKYTPGKKAGGKTNNKPVPSAADKAYVKAHPETAAKYKEHFGEEP